MILRLEDFHDQLQSQPWVLKQSCSIPTLWTFACVHVCWGVWGIPRTVGSLATSLASSHQMPVAPLPLPTNLRKL